VTEDRPFGRELRWPAVGVLTAFVVAGALMRDPPEPGLCVIGGVVAVGAASLLCVRGARTAVALAILAGVGVGLVAGSHDESLAWFGLCVLAFWVVIVAGPKLGLLFVLVAEALLVTRLLTGQSGVGWAPWIAGVAVSAGGAALIARQQQLMGQLRAAQAGLAERSRAEERNRIARDLHDVIAHSLTVSLLHISSARLAVSEDPAEATRALAEAERLGRESLDEVRSIVGLMRSGAGDDGSRPSTSSWSAFAALARRSRSSAPATLRRSLRRPARRCTGSPRRRSRTPPNTLPAVPCRLASTRRPGAWSSRWTAAGAPGMGRAWAWTRCGSARRRSAGPCRRVPQGPDGGCARRFP